MGLLLLLVLLLWQEGLVWKSSTALLLGQPLGLTPRDARMRGQPRHQQRLTELPDGFRDPSGPQGAQLPDGRLQGHTVAGIEIGHRVGPDRFCVDRIDRVGAPAAHALCQRSGSRRRLQGLEQGLAFGDEAFGPQFGHHALEPVDDLCVPGAEGGTLGANVVGAIGSNLCGSAKPKGRPSTARSSRGLSAGMQSTSTASGCHAPMSRRSCRRTCSER